VDPKDELIIKMGDELLRMSQHLSRLAERKMASIGDIKVKVNVEALATSEELIREFLARELAEDPNRDGMKDTPKRFIKAFREMTAGYHVKIADLFTVFEPDGYDQMILVKDVTFSSLCEHHLLPFRGKAAVAYVPHEPGAGPRKIVGLSKLARVVDAFAMRCQVQERMTKEIAEAVWDNLAPAGVAVLVEAHHQCMSCRGVRKAEAVMVTSALLGCFRNEPETRAEFFSLVKG
jgi:GTP cyclohydrolase I